MRNNQQFAMVSIFPSKCLHGANDQSSNCYRERLNDIRCSCTSRLDSDLWLRICRMGMKKCCQFLMEQHPKEPLRRYCRQRATLNKQHLSTKQDSTTGVGDQKKLIRGSRKIFPGDQKKYEVQKKIIHVDRNGFVWKGSFQSQGWSSWRSPVSCMHFWAPLF